MYRAKDLKEKLKSLKPNKATLHFSAGGVGAKLTLKKGDWVEIIIDDETIRLDIKE